VRNAASKSRVLLWRMAYEMAPIGPTHYEGIP
jgi:hypothetical protein